MEIYPFDKKVEDVFTKGDIEGIQADGISIRSGNKIIHLQVTEEVVVDDTDLIKKDLEIKFEEQYKELEDQFIEYKQQMIYSIDQEKRKIENKQRELDKLMSENQILPNLTEDLFHQGLSVAIRSEGGLIWSYKTVYAPVFIGKRKIDPVFAKRLVTPICIECITNSTGKIINLITRQILGNKKFYHYHAMSQNSDCWGNFTYSDKTITDPDEMLDFLKNARDVLDVINDMSIASRTPRGLSRLGTIEKHLLDPEDNPENERIKLTSNSRNSRSGVDMEERQDESESTIWST